MKRSPFDQRPIIVALTGSNGAGKTTFFHAHLRLAGLRFINADEIARELRLDPYAAAKVADAIRRELVEQRESFVFETVFSDPAGDKLGFLKAANNVGYTVVLCFIGISSSDVSEQRVAMRVSQGGHDVPPDKLISRFPRTLANLQAAIRELPHVLIYDNDNISTPYRLAATFEHGQLTQRQSRLPRWLRNLLVQ